VDGSLPNFYVKSVVPADRCVAEGDIALRVLGGALGIVGSPASIVLWFGMMAFCVFEDPSPVRHKILGFLLFFATASFGLVAYFF
jgi:hypothetical protein